MRWSPDNCGCKVNVTNDWALENVQVKCPVHQAIPDGELLAVLQDDCREVATVQRHLLGTEGPGGIDRLHDGKGSFVAPFRKEWSGEGRDRVCTMTFEGADFTPGEKERIHGAVRGQLGSRVEIA